MKVVAMYLRLPQEDERETDGGESNSISNQRMMLCNFIQQDTELREYEAKEFIDDGWSGTDMDRPGMNHLLSEIRKNRIQCIIVKDMSRFSRDYIEMGTYLNQIFPFMGIRFIALGDHYDSRECGGNMIGIDIVFQTLLYDLYSKDISVKVKASFENKCASGEYVFGQVPFGYRKNPEERNAIIVDEKEAEIVRYIFSLALQKKSSAQIAIQLQREGIPTIMQIRKPDKKTEDGKVHAWSSQSVRNILNNRFYLGEMLYGKTVRDSVGSKKHTAIPKEKWKVIPDHHEALITPEVFEQVSIFRPGYSTKRKREKHPLTGKLYCGGCGYAMVYKPLQGKNRYRHFECYRHALLQIPECCTYFSADILEKLVLTMINKELMLRGKAEEQEKCLNSFQKSRIVEMRKRLEALHQEKKKVQYAKEALYESYAIGSLTPEEYRREADRLEEQADVLNRQSHDGKEGLLRPEEEGEWIGLDGKRVVRDFHMEKLTQDLVNIFMKKIYVYKDRRVEIEWNFREK